jgi:tungstate transport system ATP-binding protein
MNIYELTDVVYKQNGFELVIKDCFLQKGGVYTVTGPNGSGKTSLLNILSLMEAPKRGTVGFCGVKIQYGDTDVLLENRRKIGYLLQDPYLFNMSVEENIAYGLKLREYAQPDIQQT